MTRQNISTGTSANDGTGDSLRAAAIKINATLVELYQMLGGDSDNLSARISFDSDRMIFAGNTFNTHVMFTDPSALRTATYPDASGTIVLDTATQILTNKTLLSPTINDDNGNELIKFTTTASAINELTIANGAAATGPTVSATGGDTNININLTPKGSGSVKLGKSALGYSDHTADGAASTSAGYIICNKATALAVSLPNGTVTGEIKIFSNKGAGTATITPSSFAGGTQIAIPTNAAASVIWDGIKWYLYGASSNVVIS